MNGLPPKMKDVAELAGVSIKTVSRVLNNEPHVKDELRDKVRNAIDSLGYVPSANARSLRSNRGYKIHYIMHNNRSNYVNSIQAGTIQTCQDHGYQLVVSMLKNIDTMSDDEIVERLGRLPAHGAPDGAVLVSPLSNHSKVNTILRSMKIPIARIGPNDIEDDEYDVKINERKAAQEITEYLIELGHHRIGFIRGKEDQNATVERYRGYVNALEAHEIEIDEDLVQSGSFEFESGFTAGKHLLALPNSPTAIFASNDDMAAGVLSAAHQLDISVPAQLSVVGFDDSELASKIWPSLTTVRQPLLELGSFATELLIAKSQNTTNASTKNFLPHEIIVRDSTGPAPK